MAKMITRLTLPLSGDETFDEIIDVRAPLEFAEDHISGAINLPVLNDQERAEVGTRSEQASFQKTSPVISRVILRTSRRGIGL